MQLQKLPFPYPDHPVQEREFFRDSNLRYFHPGAKVAWQKDSGVQFELKP